jgi:hypothetical protein
VTHDLHTKTDGVRTSMVAQPEGFNQQEVRIIKIVAGIQQSTCCNLLIRISKFALTFLKTLTDFIALILSIMPEHSPSPNVATATSQPPALKTPKPQLSFSCNACGLAFDTSQDQRTHMRQPWQ